MIGLMTNTTAHDDVRAAQRDLWNRFAGGWETWHDVVDSVLGPVGKAMIDALDIAVDQRHLDVACGTGEPGLTIASIAGRGTVTLADISPGCSTRPARRAVSAVDLDVAVHECSADDLPFADGSFDVSPAASG